MAGIGTIDSGQAAADVALREPRQRRTREQWDRVLDAGVQLLEEGGYEAFTIAALCRRGEVPPRALYARAATKDGLFLAVYERGMSRVLADQAAFAEPDGWAGDDMSRISQAVNLLVKIFSDNAAFLRAVVLISGAHPEVQRRGASYRQELGDIFAAALPPIVVTSPHPDARQAHDFCFSLIFSALVVRTAYGPGFGVPGDVSAMTRELVTMAQRYLRPGAQPEKTSDKTPIRAVQATLSTT